MVRQNSKISVVIGIIAILLVICLAYFGVYRARIARIQRDFNDESHYNSVDEATSKLSANPNDPKALRTMARYYITQRNHAEALVYWQKDVDVEPDNRAAKFHLGTLLRVSGKWKEAMPLFESLAKEDDHLGQLSKEILKGHDFHGSD